MIKITFKNEKKARWDKYERIAVKFNGARIGAIIEQSDGRYHINLAIIKTENKTDGNENCEWMWVTLKARFNSRDEAKQFIIDKQDQIVKQYTLFMGLK